MDAVKNKIDSYLSEINKWNKKINLVSDHDLDIIYERHYLDSIQVLKEIPFESRLLDMGSGNGFPSIPIAVHRPDVKVVAVEVKKKKAIFLENAAKKLNLENYTVLNMEIRKNPPDLISSFDVITSRAFKDAPTSLELCFFYAKNMAKLLYFNALITMPLQCFSAKNLNVIHNVNNIVYKLKNSQEQSIAEIVINK